MVKLETYALRHLPPFSSSRTIKIGGTSGITGIVDRFRLRLEMFQTFYGDRGQSKHGGLTNTRG